MKDADGKLSFPFEVVATQSLMAQRIALREIDSIRKEVESINEPCLTRCYWFNKYLKFTANGLTQRQTHLFNINARNTAATDKDYKIVQQLLDEVIEGLQPEVKMLNRCLAKYISFNECTYEKLISLFLTVGTMLRHAVDVFDLIESPWEYIKQGYNIYSTVDRIKPQQELQNFTKAVKYTNIMPDDIDYMSDMDVHNCVVIIADKMGKEFVSKFTKKML